MKKTLLLIAALLFVSVVGCYAQKGILVSGTVVGSADGEPLTGVHVMRFKNAEICQKEYEAAIDFFNQGIEYYSEHPFVIGHSDGSGRFEIVAESDNALLFVKTPFKPVIVKIDGRKELPDVVIENVLSLDEAAVIADSTARDIPFAPHKK